MLLEARNVGPFFKNGFVLGCEEAREAVVIDPGDEIDELLQVVEDAGLTVTYILLTHAHMDHVAGVARAKQRLGAPICLHADDHFLYQRAPEQARSFGYQMDPPPPVDLFYHVGAEHALTFGQYRVVVHHTPGHSPGGVCLQAGRIGEFGKQLFVGDSLFAGSIGRTDLLGGDYDTLIRSITTVLYNFGDDAEVFPGHGPKTTIGEERRANPFLRELG